MLYHPFIVHFPVAFLLLGSFFLGVFLFLKKEEYERLGTQIIFLGYLGLVGALVSGLIDCGGFSGRPVRHSNFGFSVLIIYTLLLIFRQQSGLGLWLDKQKKVIYLTLIVLGVILTVLTSYTGGEEVLEMMFK